MLYVSESVLCSVVSDSLSPHRLQPTRLLCPLESPGKTTGVGSHYLHQGIFPIQGSNPRLLHYRWSPALQADSLPSEPPAKSHYVNRISVGTSPVVQWLRLCSQCRGRRFHPWSGNQIPHAMTKSSHAMTKTWQNKYIN